MKYDYDWSLRTFKRLAIPLLCICFFRYHIDKIFAAIPFRAWFQFAFVIVFILYILGSLAALFLMSLWQLTQIKGYWEQYGRRALYPLLIGIGALLFVRYGRDISSECFESRKVYQAYRKAAAAGQTITLRANSTCEVKTSSFGISQYRYALWRKSNDTIYIMNDTADIFPFDTFTVVRNGLNAIVGETDSGKWYLSHQYKVTLQPN